MQKVLLPEQLGARGVGFILAFDSSFWLLCAVLCIDVMQYWWNSLVLRVSSAVPLSFLGDKEYKAAAI